MGSVNKVILVGNLGRDAELRYTPGGAPVATLNLATTEVWNDKGGQRQEKTEWHRVILWGKSAESLSEYLVKGKQIYVEGRLQTRQWDDKDGNKRYTTEIRSDRVVLLSGGGGGGMGAGRSQGRARRCRRGRAPGADGGARHRADRRRHSVLEPKGYDTDTDSALVTASCLSALLPRSHGRGSRAPAARAGCRWHRE